jgi:hypothetical protein
MHRGLQRRGLGGGAPLRPPPSPLFVPFPYPSQEAHKSPKQLAAQEKVASKSRENRAKIQSGKEITHSIGLCRSREARYWWREGMGRRGEGDLGGRRLRAPPGGLTSSSPPLPLPWPSARRESPPWTPVGPVRRWHGRRRIRPPARRRLAARRAAVLLFARLPATGLGRCLLAPAPRDCLARSLLAPSPRPRAGGSSAASCRAAAMVALRAAVLLFARVPAAGVGRRLLASAPRDRLAHGLLTPSSRPCAGGLCPPPATGLPAPACRCRIAAHAPPLPMRLRGVGSGYRAPPLPMRLRGVGSGYF